MPEGLNFKIYELGITTKHRKLSITTSICDVESFIRKVAVTRTMIPATNSTSHEIAVIWMLIVMLRLRLRRDSSDNSLSSTFPFSHLKFVLSFHSNLILKMTNYSLANGAIYLIIYTFL